jgi:hypothetical protein
MRRNSQMQEKRLVLNYRGRTRAPYLESRTSWVYGTFQEFHCIARSVFCRIATALHVEPCLRSQSCF